VSIAVQWKGTATHKEEFFGIAPTGKRVTVGGISIIQIVDGKIIREVTCMDMLDVLQKIGSFPTSS
jgi:predicted ester cyclase